MLSCSECLERAGLWKETRNRLNESGAALSGGQLQRLCIARSLAVRPRVLLMDEPCSALDPISTSVIEGTIRDLSDDITIVIVTHNMQQASRVSDNCALFLVDGEGQPGHIVEAGSDRGGLQRPHRPSHGRLRPRAVRLMTTCGDHGPARPAEVARRRFGGVRDQARLIVERRARRGRRTAVQMGALLAVVVIAYSYSLTTLLQLADLNTPLAYVSLVPVISLILAASAAASRGSPNPPSTTARRTTSSACR